MRGRSILRLKPCVSAVCEGCNFRLVTFYFKSTPGMENGKLATPKDYIEYLEKCYGVNVKVVLEENTSVA
jgi:hypothetical protein